MTAPDPRVGEIEARASEFRPCKTDCCGSTECQSERDIAYLLAELRDRGEKLARVAELHTEDLFRGHLSNGCKTCGNGECGYPCPTAAAVAASNGGGER